MKTNLVDSSEMRKTNLVDSFEMRSHREREREPLSICNNSSSHSFACSIVCIKNASCKKSLATQSVSNRKTNFIQFALPF